MTINLNHFYLLVANTGMTIAELDGYVWTDRKQLIDDIGQVLEDHNGDLQIFEIETGAKPVDVTREICDEWAAGVDMDFFDGEFSAAFPDWLPETVREDAISSAEGEAEYQKNKQFHATWGTR